MCAINGFNSSDREKIERMVEVTRHRGPDGSGVEVLPECSLGHARLKVIDLSDAASQPMWNRDKTLCIVFNGEIYNYRELRERLSGQYRFSTESDTEVLLALYEKEGLESLSMLNGIFALAIWDTRKKELVLARDPAGVKPLYYTWDGKRLVFSSEAKAIISAGERSALNEESLPLYLSLGFVPGEQTLFRDIKKLEAGSYAVLKGSDLRFERFSSRLPAAFGGGYREAVRELRQTVESAVRRQMVSDRPVGIFLSGGIDSTALAALAASVTGETIRTFTTRFDFDRDPKFNADADIAKRTASRLGAQHTEILVTAKDFMDGIGRVGWHLDEPNANSSAGAVDVLARTASDHVAVLLSGDGADELFGGYERYRVSRKLDMMRRIPYVVRKNLAQVLRGRVQERYLRKLRIRTDAEQYLSFWLTEEFPKTHEMTTRHFQDTYFAKEDSDLGNRIMRVDRETWLREDALMKLDKLLAASGIEGRVPYLDRELVRFADAIPSKWKLPQLWNDRGRGKRIMVDALHDLLPEEVRDRRKTGWFAPMAKWLRRPEVHAAFRERLGSLPAGAFSPDRAVALLDDHQKKGGYHLKAIWTLISLQIWLERFNVKA